MNPPSACIRWMYRPCWVCSKLIGNGATVVVVEHDLDVIRNADYLVNMGPGGGDAGGRIVTAGTPEQVNRTRRASPGGIS